LADTNSLALGSTALPTIDLNDNEQLYDVVPDLKKEETTYGMPPPLRDE